ncbi:hypothetical protein D3C78_466550 [compost metagenome]
MEKVRRDPGFSFIVDILHVCENCGKSLAYDITKKTAVQMYDESINEEMLELLPVYTQNIKMIEKWRNKSYGWDIEKCMLIVFGIQEDFPSF